MSATLHTTAGDLKIELFCEAAPMACENWLALAASGQYDKTIFHRNIKVRDELVYTCIVIHTLQL